MAHLAPLLPFLVVVVDGEYPDTCSLSMVYSWLTTRCGGTGL